MNLFLAILTGLFILAIPVTAFLLARRWARRAYRNDTSKAVVYVKAGNDFMPPVKGRRVYNAGEGEIYIYAIDGKEFAVILSKEYAHEFISGRRVIGVKDGVAYANPLGQSHAPLPNEGSEDIANLVKGKVFNDLVYSLHTSAMPVMLVIILLLVLAVGGFFVYNQFNKPAQPAVAPPANGQTIPEPTNTPPVTLIPRPVEVK